MKVTGMWERLPHSIRQQGECETKRTVHPSGAHRQEGAIHHHASLGTASLHTLGSPSCCSESWKTSLRSLSFCAIVYPLLSLFLPLYCFFFSSLFAYCQMTLRVQGRLPGVDARPNQGQLWNDWSVRSEWCYCPAPMFFAPNKNGFLSVNL